MKSWTFPLQSDTPVISALKKSNNLTHEQEETSEGYLMDTYVWSALQAGILCLRSNTQINCLDYHNPGNDFVLQAETDEAHRALYNISKDWLSYKRARCSLYTNHYLVRNKDEKGICRIKTTRFISEEPADMQFVRVVLDPLRGYEKESSFLETAVEDLQQAYPLPVLKLPLDIPPETPQITPHMTARTAVIQLSVHMIDTARFYEKGIIDGTDQECLHQYRVSLRRLRALLSLLKDVFPSEDVQRWRDELSCIMKGTNQLRDLDVQLEDLTLYMSSIPDDYQNGYQTIIERSEKARESEYVQVARFLHSADYNSRMDAVRAEIENAAALAPTESSSLSIKTVVDSVLYARYKKIQKRIKKLTGHEDYSHIHKVRIEGKKLRYLCEFFPSLYPDSLLKPVIKQLKKVQNALGDYNDACTQREFFQAQAQHARENNEIDTALAVGGITTIIDQKGEALKSKALDRVRSFTKGLDVSKIFDF